MSTAEFRTKNDIDWKKIHFEIFGEIVPNHCEWTKISDIIAILNKIGVIRNSNHMFFPNGGGLDLLGAKESYEDGCIELLVGSSYIIKPKSLIFEGIDDEFEWNYFRIETQELNPSGVYDERSSKITSEQLCEISPLHYVDSYHWDENEYNGEQLPKSARRIVRLLKGSMVIFKKSSIYNNNTSTYDGRHETLGAHGFKNHILQAASVYK